MIKNYKKYREFELEFNKNNETTLEERFQMFEKMYLWWRIINNNNHFYSIEDSQKNINIAKAINALAKKATK